MSKQRTLSCNATCSLRRAISEAWSIESGRITFETAEPDATATSEDNEEVGACEVGEFDLALPFPLFDDYTHCG